MLHKKNFLTVSPPPFFSKTNFEKRLNEKDLVLYDNRGKRASLQPVLIFFLGFCFFLISFLPSYAQVKEISLRTLTPDAEPIALLTGNLQFNNTYLNQLFANYTITDYYKRFPTAAQVSHPLAESLLRVWIFACDCDVQQLINDLETNAGQYFDRIVEMEETQVLTQPCVTDDPKDAEWSNWRHDNLCVREAWCLTTGSPDIRIAIMDIGFDINHPDLVNKIDQPAPYWFC